jgi:hypothetical protein
MLKAQPYHRIFHIHPEDGNFIFVETLDIRQYAMRLILENWSYTLNSILENLRTVFTCIVWSIVNKICYDKRRSEMMSSLIQYEQKLKLQTEDPLPLSRPRWFSV